jgi:hypothetical protein
VQAYMTDRYFTLTSTIGVFSFHRETLMSHAKLVRDTIMYSLLNGESIRAQTAQRWFREHTDGPAKHTEFVWTPA